MGQRNQPLLHGAPLRARHLERFGGAIGGQRGVVVSQGFIGQAQVHGGPEIARVEGESRGERVAGPIVRAGPVERDAHIGERAGVARMRRAAGIELGEIHRARLGRRHPLGARRRREPRS